MDSPHQNHRQRLKNTALENGFGSLDDLTLLELLLTYALPRRDTRPLAAELLNKFGSLSAIIDADNTELEKVSGISRHTAIMFKCCLELSRRIGCAEHELSFESGSVAGKYLKSYFAGETREKVAVLTLTPSGSLIGSYTVQYGSINSASFTIRSVTEIALKDDSNKIILAHNHPDGALFPSDADLSTTDRVAKALIINNITLCEHYIITKDGYLGILHSK